MNKPTTRGGKRKGSGRPKLEPTKTISIRVPERVYMELKEILNNTVKNYLKE
jgi:hypothetical protein